MHTYERMGLGAHRKAIQRDCGRVRGIYTTEDAGEAVEGLNELREREGKKKRTHHCALSWLYVSVAA